MARGFSSARSRGRDRWNGANDLSMNQCVRSAGLQPAYPPPSPRKPLRCWAVHGHDSRPIRWRWVLSMNLDSRKRLPLGPEKVDSRAEWRADLEVPARAGVIDGMVPISKAHKQVNIRQPAVSISMPGRFLGSDQASLINHPPRGTRTGFTTVQVME